jgi:hypothetical protein
MRDLKDVTATLIEPLPTNRVKSFKGKGGGQLQYLKIGGVGFSMNEIFGPLGWDYIVKELMIVMPPHRIDNMGHASDKGGFYNAIASATVSVRARARVNQDGSCIETTREDSACGAAFGGKARTPGEAVHAAVSTAVTTALKRACRMFGPKTGLTLQFDPGERDMIQRELSASAHLEQMLNGDTDTIEEVESDDIEVDVAEVVTVEEPATEEVAEEQVDQPAAEEQTEEAPAEEAPTEEAAVAQAEETEEAPADEDATAEEAPADQEDLDPPAVIAAFITDADLFTRIWSGGPDDKLSSKDIGAFHKAMSATFTAKGAHALWVSAGVTPGKDAVVTKTHIAAIAQVLEEAHAKEGGLEAFVAQFETPQEKPVHKNGTNGNGNGVITFGDWGTPDQAKAYLKKRLGPGKEVLLEALVTIADNHEIDKNIAGQLQAYAHKACTRAGVTPMEPQEIWRQTGYEFKPDGEQILPNGHHARQFIRLLPE